MIKNQKFCPICLSESSENFFIASSSTYTNTIPIELKVNICMKCEAFYLREFVDESEISKYYSETYYTKSNILDTQNFNFRVRELSYHLFKGYPKKINLSLKLFLASIIYRIFYWHRFERFPNFLKNISDPSILEIGYGGGNYLLDAKNLGWDCYGIDVDQTNSEQLKSKGISVAEKFTNLKFSKKKIDYIYSYHAFEHIYDIEDAMKNSFDILSNDGIFKLCVPMSDGILPKIFKKYWYDLGVPIHKQIYSYKGIKLLADRHGFKVYNYKYNSYSESLFGSIVASLIGFIRYKKKSAQEITSYKVSKFICLIISPLVIFIDIIKLGDRAEFTLIKK